MAKTDELEHPQCLMHTPPCIRINGRWERPETAHCTKSESGYHVWSNRREGDWCVECGLTASGSRHG